MDEYHDVDTTLNATKLNNTFKNAYDRLNPAEQTRSKSTRFGQTEAIFGTKKKRKITETN